MNPFLEISRATGLLAFFQRDPRLGLLYPKSGAGHSVERFEVCSTEGTVPAVWLRPLPATGATVVYAHGGGTADILPSAPLFEALLKRGVGIVAFTFPGFGDHPADLTFPAALECLPAVLSAVRERTGDARVAVYGLSLGAVFAMHAAKRAPWLTALALFGPPLDLSITDNHRRRELFGTFHPFAAPVLLDAPSGHLARLFLEPVRFGPNEHHLLFEEAFAARAGKLLVALDPLNAAAETPSIPVLLLGGEWDAAASPDQLRLLASRFAGPHELKIFAHRTHTTLLYDRDVAEYTADWLAAHLNAPT
jgi:pimeloyl-ACP methyl ester carboxylesterase